MIERNVRSFALIFAFLFSMNGATVNPAGADFPTTELTIFSADGTQVIGYGRYTLRRADEMEILGGESRYLNGEHDIELERLEPDYDGQVPRLVNYEHSFFNADQSRQRVVSLDVASGTGSCKTYLNGKLGEDRGLKLTVPADTYAGAAQATFIVTQLRASADTIRFHSFNCMPGPTILMVEAVVAEERVRWPLYPGELLKVEIRPDIGWLNHLIAPFIAHMYAWFDPADNWNYVGGYYDRFYQGPRILTVRARSGQSR